MEKMNVSVEDILKQLVSLDEKNWRAYFDNFFPAFVVSPEISRDLGYAADIVIKDYNRHPYTMNEVLEIRTKTTGEDASSKFQDERITRLYRDLYAKFSSYNSVKEEFLSGVSDEILRRHASFLIDNNKARLDIHFSQQVAA